MTLPAYLPKGILGNIGLFINSFIAGGVPATLVITNAGPPVNGAVGTGTAATFAPPGQPLIDTINGILYTNTGTKASPVWTAGIGGAGGASSVVTGITASTTHTLAGSTKLTAKTNYLSTVANASDAVGLPVMAVGQSVEVFNDGAHPAAIWPPATVAIDNGSVGAAATLTNALRCTYRQKDATHIESSQLGAISA